MKLDLPIFSVACSPIYQFHPFRKLRLRHAVTMCFGLKYFLKNKAGLFTKQLVEIALTFVAASLNCLSYHPLIERIEGCRTRADKAKLNRIEQSRLKCFNFYKLAKLSKHVLHNSSCWQSLPDVSACHVYLTNQLCFVRFSFV